MVIDWFLLDRMTEVCGSSTEGWFWRDVDDPHRVAGPYADTYELMDAIMCHRDRKLVCLTAVELVKVLQAEREGRH
jgi:hypothetical protein